MNIIYKLFLPVLVVSIFTSCSKESTEDKKEEVPTTVLSGRDSALKSYKEMYLLSEISDIGWNGNINDCNAGSISKTSLDKLLLRINYYRTICGLPNKVTLNTTFNEGSQKMALMMEANNAVSSVPPSSWKCFSQDGYNAALKSLFALNTQSSDVINYWVKNEAFTDKASKARRWILFSRANEFGIGCTNNASSFYCVNNTDANLPDNCPRYVAFPPRYIPQSLVSKQWSMSIPNFASFFSGVNFENATVKVSDTLGNVFATNIISRNDNGSGDQTLVWETSGIQTNAATDQKYLVTVDSVFVNNIYRKYSYEVNMIKP